MRAGKKSLDKVRNSKKHEVITLTGSALQSGVDKLMASRARESWNSKEGCAGQGHPESHGCHR